MTRICDILLNEYKDFCDYCNKSGLFFVSDVSNYDLVAFRSITGCSREYIQSIKNTLFSSIKEEDYTRDIVVDEENNVEEKTTNSFDCHHNNSTVLCSLPALKKQIISLECEFGICSSDFSNNSLEELRLSFRSYNCLRRANLETICDLLHCSRDELRSMRNLGAKSFDEIIEKLKNYINENVIDDEKEFEKAIESQLNGNNVNDENLSEKQKMTLEKIALAQSIIGNELCLDAYQDPVYVARISHALNCFAESHFNKKTLLSRCQDVFNLLSDYIKNRKTLPLLDAYEVKGDGKLFCRLLKAKPEITINESSKVLDLYENIMRLDDVDLIEGFTSFFSWIYSVENDIKNDFYIRLKDYFVNKHKRYWDVINQRQLKKSLDEIGMMLGVSRERVRQIERKAIIKLRSFFLAQMFDPIMICYAFRDGDEILYYDEIKDLFGEAAKYIWLYINDIQKGVFYYFSKDINAIVINKNSMVGNNEKQLKKRVQDVILMLPSIIHISQLNEVIELLSKEKDVSEEIIKKHIISSYNCFGKFYSKKSISVVFMCEYTLKNRFPNGYKTGDEYEEKRFKDYLIEYFGDRAKSITYRAIDAKVCDIGVLCERGKYIHPDFLQVDKVIIDLINDYIEKSNRSVLTYGELFEAMSEQLAETQISNRYLLQGALKKYGCNYFTGRDFVRKTQNVSFVDELDAFVEKRGIVHKEEIFAAFTSLNESSLVQVVARSSTVFNIDNGYYIHASQFDIQPNDYIVIREYLANACEEIPVNIRSVYDTISNQFPDFMYRNDFGNRNKLFAALNYMFREEFSFSRPYIAKLGINDITNKSVILQHISEYDSIEIGELIDICEENSIRYVSISALFQQLAPEYIRVDSHKLVKCELTGITDEIIKNSVEIVNDFLEANDYVVGSKINDFLWFPQIELDWNTFLLESLMILSGKMNIVYLVGDPLVHPNAIYVSDKYKGDNYNSLLIKVLSEEVRNGQFLSKVEMRDWLKEEGLIEDTMPKFLESAKYFYVDGTGVHCADN